MPITDESDSSGDRVLITGAASGIGRALAIELASSGTQLHLLDRSPGVQQLAEQLEADWTIFDLAELEPVADLAAEVGKINGLVNAAGIPDPDRFPDSSLDEWHRVLTVNLAAPHFLVQALVGNFPEAGGSIINVASLSSRRVVATTGYASHAYSASKAGLVMLTKTLAHELATRKIRVNSVSPGFVLTPISRMAQGADSPVPGMTPMGRWGEPEEVVQAIAFLLSRNASFITGVDLVVDGGLGLSVGSGRVR